MCLEAREQSSWIPTSKRQTSPDTATLVFSHSLAINVCLGHLKEMKHMNSYADECLKS